MPSQDSERVSRLAAAIAEYLAVHPNAADSLTGIQQWWLPGGRVENSVDEVRQAVAMLVEQGTLRCTVLADGTQVYGRAQPGNASGDATP